MSTLFLLLLVTQVSEVDAGVETPKYTSTVIGNRGPDLRRIAGSAATVSEADLERRELNDIHRVLGEVTGVYSREEDGTGLRPNIGLRGANPDRSAKVTLLEDGVLFAPAPYSAPAAYYFPLVTRLVGVDVYKGPAAIRFGPQTIAGAINLRTREVPSGPLLQVDVMGGTRFHGRGHLVAGWGTETWGVLAEAVVLRDSGFKVLDTGSNTGFEHAEVMLKGRLSPGDAWQNQLELKATLSFEDSRETYLGLSATDFAENPDRRYAASALDQMRWNRLALSVGWKAQPSRWLTVTATGYRQTFHRTWNRVDRFRRGPELYRLLEAPIAGGLDARYLAVLRGAEDSTSADESLLVLTNDRTFVSQGIQAQSTAQFSTGPIQHELEFSARLHSDEILRNHLGTTYATRSGRLERDDEPVSQQTLNRGLTVAGAFHAHDTMQWGRLLVSPGVRVELMDLVGLDLLAKTSSRTFQAVPLLGVGAVLALPWWGLNVVGGVHQGFSPVTPGQSPDIKPERATHFELGVRLPGKKRRFEVIGFWSEYTNITGECTGSTGCADDAINRQFNGGAARIIGVEVSGAARFELGREVQLTPQLTYTLTSAQFGSDFTSANPIWGTVRAGDLLPYVPTHQASARVVLDWKALSASVGFEASGGFREEAEAGAPIAGQRALLDASASYALGAFTFYVQGSNLLNQRSIAARRPFGARPIAPLAVQGGVKARWP
jgi:Fe(3+) dicitrate transport protein